MGITDEAKEIKGEGLVPPRVFKYLLQGDGARGEPRDRLDVLDMNFRRKDLVTRPVVRDEFNNHRFLVFEDRAGLRRWRDHLPAEQRCFHEVIFGWQPQRIKIDIDAPAHKLDALSDATLNACLGEEVPAAALDAYVESILSDEGATPATTARTEGVPDDLKVARDRKMRRILECVIDTLLDELYAAYYMIENVTATRRQVVVAESCGNSPHGWKYSYHVLIAPYALPDNTEARELTARVLESLPEPIRPFIDAGVNKSIQNFRLGGCTKAGETRFKTVSEDTARRLGTMVMGVDETMIVADATLIVLPRTFTTGALDARGGGRGIPIANEIVRLAVKAAESVTDGHTLRCVRGALLVFERERPTMCAICSEMHHHDNTLMITLEAVEAGHEGAWPGPGPVPHRLVEHCRHAPGKGRTVAEIECPLTVTAIRAPQRRLKKDDTPMAHDVAGRILAIKEGKVDPHAACASAFEQLHDARKTVYSEPSMRTFENVATLAIRAQMGLGKTRELCTHIDTNFPKDGVQTPVIRFVTFRQTFSASLKRDGLFPDFELYSDHTGDLDAVRFPRLIVQVESLHRLHMPANPEPVDLVVLDEVESILAQFNSGLHKHFASAFAMFRWLMQTARHVICMDANLGDRTFRILELLRADKPVHFHWNKFERAAGDKYLFTGDKAVWLERLCAAVRAGCKIAVPSNSLAEAKALEQLIRTDFPDREVGLYSSETLPSERARHFADVHEYWSRLDVLIYTPTVSAGVSYEEEHFDCLFGYFTDTSCDVETCRQMLGRVRNLRSKEHFIYLQGTGNNLPTTVDDIRKLINDKRAGLYRTVSDSALQFEYTPSGDIRYYESSYFYLWMETVRVENLSKNTFVRRFIDQVADTGAQTDILATDSTKADLAALLGREQETKQDLKMAHERAVADAAEIGAEEAAEIRDEMQRQADVLEPRRLSLERWNIEETYDWHGRPMNGEFVGNYGKADVKRVYKNLIQITSQPTVARALQEMREREQAHYQFAMETRTPDLGYVNEGRDLQRDKTTYVFQSHFFAIWMLRLCGFVCITDKTWIVATVLDARLRAGLAVLDKAARAIAFEFQTRTPFLLRWRTEPNEQKFISALLRFMNPVFRAMYGLEVKRTTKRAGGDAYYLSHTRTGRLFVFSDEPEPDAMPHGALPKPHIPSRLTPPEVNRAACFLDEAYIHQLTTARPDDEQPGAVAPGNDWQQRIDDHPDENDPVPKNNARPRAYVPASAAGTVDFLDLAYSAAHI